jgi:hypothetical protein
MHKSTMARGTNDARVRGNDQLESGELPVLLLLLSPIIIGKGSCGHRDLGRRNTTRNRAKNPGKKYRLVL